MIISHKHKYVFIELPMTGSTAINNELRENYDGIYVLKKHSSYRDFLKDATEEEKRYFVFAGIRHPLDQVVSHYFKFKTGHDGQFTRPAEVERHKKNLMHRLAYGYSHVSRYEFVQKNNADFGTFFLRYYKVPYNNWSSLDHKRFDFVIRFEDLAGDFAKVIEMLGLELKRPLPLINRTQDKKKNFFDYYDTPELRERAKYVFSPFMRQWGYHFPPEWGDTTISLKQRAEYEFFNVFRGFYWRYLRHPEIPLDSLSLADTRQHLAEQF